MRLLVTRPEPDCECTAVRLRAHGHDAIVAPLLRIEFLSPDFGPGPFAAVIVTSANAARALAVHPRRQELLRLAAYAVGRRSADAVREAGFQAVVSADGDVKDLIRLVGSRLAGTTAPLLYLAGRDRAEDLGAALGRYGLSVRTVTVYRAVMRSTLPPETRAALSSGGLDGVLHYSRRSAEAFVSAADASGVLTPALVLPHYCLSADVAAPLAAAGARNVKIAARPEENALFQLLSLG